MSSVFVHCLLISLVWFRKRVGRYRYLLLLFSLVDICISVARVLTLPVWPPCQNLQSLSLPLAQVAETVGAGFTLRAHGLCDSVVALCVNYGFYGVFFPLLVFHFLYRVVAVERFVGVISTEPE